MIVLDPAFGSGEIDTLTDEVLVTLPQAPLAVTVYVYVPEGSLVGWRIPECTDPFGAVHEPPALGVPPSRLNKLVGAALAQSVTFPFVPALTVLSTEMVTQSVLLHAG